MSHMYDDHLKTDLVKNRFFDLGPKLILKLKMAVTFKLISKLTKTSKIVPELKFDV